MMDSSHTQRERTIARLIVSDVPTHTERLTAFAAKVRLYARVRRDQQQLGQHIADQAGHVCDEDRDELIDLAGQEFLYREEIVADALILSGNGVLDRCIDLVDLETRGIV